MQDPELPEAIKRSMRSVGLGEMCLGFAHEHSAQLFQLSALLSSLFAKIDRPDLKEMKVQISALVDNMQAMLNRLRLFAMPSEHSREPIEKVIHAAAELLSHCFRSKAVVLRINVSPEAKPIMVPSDLLLQVLLNLLLNAVEYVPAKNGSILIHAKAASSQLHISVVDNGSGISDSLRERIWEPFFTTSPNRTGLGLAITRQLLSEIGGSISLDTGYVHGSRFVVCLPERYS